MMKNKSTSDIMHEYNQKLKELNTAVYNMDNDIEWASNASKANKLGEELRELKNELESRGVM